MRYTVIILLTSSVIFLSTCLDPADIQPAGFEDYLVVEGFITDQPGPHKFKISRVTKFAGAQQGGAIQVEKNLQVTIINQNGEKTLLEPDISQFKNISCTGLPYFRDIQEGYKTSPSFCGQVGNTYVLEIKDNENNVYRSEPQYLSHTPPISDVILQFKEIPSTDRLFPRSGVEIFCNWQDPIEEENFYFWQLNGVYLISTSADEILNPDFPISGGLCPPCILDVTDDGSEECYIIENDIEENLYYFSDELVNGQFVTKSIGFIEDNGRRFSIQNLNPEKLYFLEVEQYEISEENYQFNKSISTLKEIDGEIFDAPPLTIRGNIFNVQDPDEVVIGYFGAYQMQKKTLFIPGSILKFKQPRHTSCGDCRVLKGSQTEIPEPFK